MTVAALAKSCLFAGAILSSAFSASAMVLPRDQSSATVNDWESITPSSDLQWTPCFQNYTCARLQVPLDYGDPSRGTTAIAFIKLAAKKVTKNTRNVLINPGGPGGSGVDILLANAIPFADVIQAEHNVVGFDPRGVSHSGPEIDCWPDHPENRAQFEKLFYSETSYASSTSLSNQFAAADFFGKACTPTVGGKNGSAAFITASAVARDLLTYIKADQRAAGKPEKDAKLFYYGISYGTLLGTTFAHLFPDNVGPMILDGVLDVEDIYKLGWSKNLYDSDKAIEAFYDFCHRGGPKNCAFWGPSVKNIRERLHKLLDHLKYNPIPVSNSPACSLPLLATYSGVKEMALQAVFLPLGAFPVFAAVLAGLEKGDATAYVAAATGGLLPANPCNNGTQGSTQEIGTLIKCVDGYGSNPLSTLDEYRDYVKSQNAQSKFLGEVWPNNANGVLCRSFEVEPPESGRLHGSILEKRKTATPILFVSAAIDPVTPERGAYKMSSVFEKSRVLIQDSVGHTAISAASSCLAQRAQEYFSHGRLPPQGTVCEPDVVPFQSA
ncbi:TAP-like protein-domain-containing protein [Aspergillus pseudoustus]|uniref:TAP-like protein-domain-containing protein n=1 Tax=Aspergillus pseudoustus TaxID=1810923 RepID=A0ABR4JLI3_9EURO